MMNSVLCRGRPDMSICSIESDFESELETDRSD